MVNTISPKKEGRIAVNNTTSARCLYQFLVLRLFHGALDYTGGDDCDLSKFGLIEFFADSIISGGNRSPGKSNAAKDPRRSMAAS